MSAMGPVGAAPPLDSAVSSAAVDDVAVPVPHAHAPHAHTHTTRRSEKREASYLSVAV